MARSVVLSIEGYEAFGKMTVTFRRRRNFESFPIVSWRTPRGAPYIAGAAKPE